jgi:hypothetical protein
MKTRTAGIAAGAIVVGAALALEFSLFTTDVSFVLTMVGGVCTPSDPQTITAGWKNKVSWTVQNNCPGDQGPQYVELRDFHHAGDAADHVVAPDPPGGGPIATGQAGTIPATVIKFRLWPRTYKYQIWVGPTANNLHLGRDPDIDVWP